MSSVLSRLRRRPGWNWVSPLAAAVGLLILTVFFRRELQDYSRSVITWAERDLTVRTDLAAMTLAEPLATSDFRRLHAFGDSCERDGVRLTVLSSGGGVIFDTLHAGDEAPDSLYAERRCGDCIVRLGLPYARVLAPVERARRGLVFAGCLGGLSVLVVFFFTYRQRLRIRALARLERFRREFIADLSHELKTPLTGILGAADLMAEEVRRLHGHDGASPVLERLAAMIGAESHRLNDLAQAVLDLARLEQEQLPLALETVDPCDLVEETVRRCAPQAAEAGLSVRTGPRPQAAVSIRCDARLVVQALSNLILNAIRHSGAPEVSVSVALRKARVEIAVEDHGVGIPEGHRARVFERFHRVDPARAAASGGAGLGLAIVRSIARLHGGDARLEPVRPAGCRFILSLASNP